MAASITLRMSRTRDEAQLYQSYAMRIEVIAATDVPRKIFVFQRGLPPAVAGNPPGTPVDHFVKIATTVDLEEFPEDGPDLDREVPYYRLDTVTLLFRALVDLQETWNYIQEDVRSLLADINTGLSDPITIEVTIP
jgi:hypothetical protein